MKWYKISDIQNNNEPFVKKVKAGKTTVCLVGYQGEVFALGYVCPHAGADLSWGWCNNGKLVCPVHRFSFDLHTGKGSEGQNDYIETYPVKMDGVDIYVGIYSFWERLKRGWKA